MQGVVWIELEPAYRSTLDFEEVRRVLENGVCSPVRARAYKDAARFVLEATGEAVYAQLVADSDRLYVEIGLVPSYFEWATVVAFEKLGGRTPNRPPEYAYRRRADVPWTELSGVVRHLRSWARAIVSRE
jgi:hypothetical protein